MLKQHVCKSKEHLAQQMDEILGDKGEGVMLKNKSSLYFCMKEDAVMTY